MWSIYRADLKQTRIEAAGEHEAFQHPQGKQLQLAIEALERRLDALNKAKKKSDAFNQRNLAAWKKRKAAEKKKPLSKKK